MVFAGAFQTEANRSGAQLDVSPRLETKFSVPQNQCNPLLEALGLRMRRAYLSDSTAYTLIRSTYFDSPVLDLFHAHFLSPEDRFKLRIRQYGPNGVWETGDAVAELKRKKGGVTSKRRLLVNWEERERLHRGETVVLRDRLLERNAHARPKAVKRHLEAINQALKSYSLAPICEITYVRHAYEAEGVRLTVDQSIESRILRPVDGDALIRPEARIAAMQMRERYDSRPQGIVELKHQGNIPQWILELLGRHQAGEVRFSKYCFGIAGGMIE